MSDALAGRVGVVIALGSGVLVAAVGAAAATTPAAIAAPAVRAWAGTETIDTYEEGPPDVNPPFDLFAGGRLNYWYDREHPSALVLPVMPRR